jgi:hypothetical protein
MPRRFWRPRSTGSLNWPAPVGSIPDESMSLQTNLFHIWQALYAGTLGAVRD